MLALFIVTIITVLTHFFNGTGLVFDFDPELPNSSDTYFFTEFTITFLVAAIVRGLDSLIIDSTDRKLYGSLKTALMVMGKDEFCMKYIKAFKEGRLE